MASYEVLIPFTDDLDHNHVYAKGKTYPREGYTPGEKRIDYLLSNETYFGKKGMGPVIRLLEAPADENGGDAGQDAGADESAAAPEATDNDAAGAAPDPAVDGDAAPGAAAAEDAGEKPKGRGKGKP